MANSDFSVLMLFQNGEDLAVPIDDVRKNLSQLTSKSAVTATSAQPQSLMRIVRLEGFDASDKLIPHFSNSTALQLAGSDLKTLESQLAQSKPERTLIVALIDSGIGDCMSNFRSAFQNDVDAIVVGERPEMENAKDLEGGIKRAVASGFAVVRVRPS